ncbi:RimK/LysX family protein [Microbacterium horticulturae]|uniref:RimK/LysX family protein n=1 Tax=Microbacterium horticulturae TaxID=3028316 RepID=A0ABY8BZZ8_9MICO|nr:RimK/LysX family protein [Microbacterium sp. KACC 23027]WEG09774.1 RimK/LysX family protein [Microbacterium sp. KACC 23027]
MTETTHPSTIAGWREWVGLPELGIPWIKAKLDTGARSSALHAFDVEPVPGQADRVRFRVLPWQESDEDAVSYECAVHDRRTIRSSSGHTAERYVVLMDVVLLGRQITAEMTLSNRDEMGFRMLIGREALRQGFVVDSARSFVGGRAPHHARRRNRGQG